MLFVSGVAALVGWQAIKDGKRQRMIRDWVFARDFIPSRNAERCILPSDLSRDLSEIIFSYEGVYAGRRALVAEYRFGSGKYSFTQTFVAVAGKSDAADQLRYGSTDISLKSLQADQYEVISLAGERLNLDDIQGYLRSLS